MKRFALLCFLLAGCSSVATQVLIEVDAEPAALADATHVRVRRFTTEGVFDQREALSERGQFPFVQPLQPDDDDAIHVAVALLRDEVVLSERVVLARFSPGERRYLRIVFDAGCEGVQCERTQSCFEGACADSCYETLAETSVSVSRPIACSCEGPPEDETCDGFDNDCDGDADEGDDLPTVCVGPGETTIFDGLQNANEGYIRVSDVRVDVPTHYVGVYAHLAPSRAPSSQQFRAVVYADEAGAPGERVASGADSQVTLSDASWVRLNLDVVLPPGRYWIGLHSGLFDDVLMYANSEDVELGETFLAIAAFDAGSPERVEWTPIQRRLTGFLERSP